VNADQPYVGYQDEVNRDKRCTSLVTDVLASSQEAADSETQGGRWVVLEKVPLTELHLLAATPANTLAQLRKYVRRCKSTREMIARALEAYADRCGFMWIGNVDVSMRIYVLKLQRCIRPCLLQRGWNQTGWGWESIKKQAMPRARAGSRLWRFPLVDVWRNA